MQASQNSVGMLVLVFASLAGVVANDVVLASDEVVQLAVWIDNRVEARLSPNREIPVVDDTTFLRRVYLDLVGRIPTVAELRDFTADKDDAKRIKVIDELLDDPRFEAHMARIWRRVLMPPSSAMNPVLAASLDDWLSQQIGKNVAFDQIAWRLVVAGGADTEQAEELKQEADSLAENPRLMSQALSSSPTAFLQHAGGQPANMASAVTRVFLGVRLECAQCHDHPFTDWTQQDFWGVAAFFAGAQLNVRRAQPAGPNAAVSYTPPMDSRPSSVSDEDGNSYTFSLPWDGLQTISVPDDELPRRYFARWLTSTDNAHFAATAVNRVWQQLCGAGLTDSVDDLDQATEAERDLILDDLAAQFTETDFDFKQLVRGICASKYYQRSSEKTQSEDGPEPRHLKVMTPEQLFDSFEVAVALPISSIDNGPRFNGEREMIVSRMEEAMGDRPDEFRSGIPQALALMNGQTTADATDMSRSKTLRSVVNAPFLNLSEKVETLFLATLSRTPHESERTRIMEYIDTLPSEQEKADAFGAVMWALINSPEFVLVR